MTGEEASTSGIQDGSVPGKGTLEGAAGYFEIREVPLMKFEIGFEKPVPRCHTQVLSNVKDVRRGATVWHGSPVRYARVGTYVPHSRARMTASPF